MNERQRQHEDTFVCVSYENESVYVKHVQHNIKLYRTWLSKLAIIQKQCKIGQVDLAHSYVIIRRK